MLLPFTPPPTQGSLPMTRQLFAAALSAAAGSVVALIIFRKIA
jgi:hypothetical protein